MSGVPEKARALRAWAHLLESSHARQKQHRTVLEGVHLLREAQAAGMVPWCWFIDAQRSHDPEIVALRDFSRWPVPVMLSAQEFAQVAGSSAAVGVVALIDWPVVSQPCPLNESCLVLDGLQDPGNVGTLLRSAAAAGFAQVVLGRGTVQVWSPKVLRAGMGGHFQLTLHESVDLSDWLPRYHGLILGALREQALVYDEVDMTGTVALVVGNEGAGLSTAVMTHLHQRVHIPMCAGIESLNAGVAGALLLFERQRQRRVKARQEGKR
ncbi:MAG: RNA methyltransferase [Betaproteobacteria bacterium]|jgi:rRNA methylases|nr:RNA methyltransferase [Betaproteobacteria bacterium]